MLPMALWRLAVCWAPSPAQRLEQFRTLATYLASRAYELKHKEDLKCPLFITLLHFPLSALPRAWCCTVMHPHIAQSHNTAQQRCKSKATSSTGSSYHRVQCKEESHLHLLSNASGCKRACIAGERWGGAQEGEVIIAQLWCPHRERLFAKPGSHSRCQEPRQGVAAARCAFLHSPCPPAGCSSAKGGALL